MKTVECLPPTSTTTIRFIGREVGAGSGADQSRHQAKWQELIDNKLIEWGRNPASLEDDDLPAPSVATIQLACRLAIVYRDANQPPPHRVCTDAAGGIVFERCSGHIFQSIRVRPDGQVEMTTFENSRLVSRDRIF